MSKIIIDDVTTLDTIEKVRQEALDIIMGSTKADPTAVKALVDKLRAEGLANGHNIKDIMKTAHALYAKQKGDEAATTKAAIAVFYCQSQILGQQELCKKELEKPADQRDPAFTPSLTLPDYKDIEEVALSSSSFVSKGPLYTAARETLEMVAGEKFRAFFGANKAQKIMDEEAADVVEYIQEKLKERPGLSPAAQLRFFESQKESRSTWFGDLTSAMDINPKDTRNDRRKLAIAVLRRSSQLIVIEEGEKKEKEAFAKAAKEKAEKMKFTQIIGGGDPVDMALGEMMGNKNELGEVTAITTAGSLENGRVIFGINDSGMKIKVSMEDVHKKVIENVNAVKEKFVNGSEGERNAIYADLWKKVRVASKTDGSYRALQYTVEVLRRAEQVEKAQNNSQTQIEGLNYMTNSKGYDAFTAEAYVHAKACADGIVNADGTVTIAAAKQEGVAATNTDTKVTPGGAPTPSINTDLLKDVSALKVRDKDTYKDASKAERDQVRVIQAILRADCPECDIGCTTPDGLLGPKTKDSITAYVAKHKIKIDPNAKDIDAATIKAMVEKSTKATSNETMLSLLDEKTRESIAKSRQSLKANPLPGGVDPFAIFDLPIPAGMKKQTATVAKT